MPGLVKLRNEHKDKLEVVGWHVGKGTEAQIEKVVKDKQLPYPVVASPGFDELQSWGHDAIPSCTLIDKKGQVRYSNLKPLEAEKRVLDLLRE